MSPEDKLKTLGLKLPEPSAPVANYVPYVISGNLVFISGQISKIGEEAIGGRLGESLTVERGQAARPDIKLGICGEHGGDPASIGFCHELGLHYVSCSPYRVPIARLSAAQAAIRSETVKA